ncbi:MAG TPA: rod shape-determining protein MreC [Solirubrobacterales bacterium]|nr:rod shape-determining protein MreC [Solirubrobacterales bacterium]
MYRKQVRRRRAILVVLVVACLMLISISISEAEDGPLHSVQTGISSVLSPVGEGASRALKPVRDLIDWFDETWEARGENEALRDEVASLRAELLETKDAAEEAGYAERLEKLIGEGGLEGFTPVDASVVGRSFSLWYETIKIDAGSSDGVARNDAVITEDGLIGRVSQVTGGSSEVALITDSTSAVTARVAGKGPEGLIGPVVGAPGKLDFGLIQGDQEVKDGDRLVTAGFTTEGGLTSRYPADIPIGQVVETIPAEQEQREQVRVEPFAELADLSSVTVLTGGESA